jgi:hypothetical protein
MIHIVDSLKITFGPLYYHFLAYDDWAHDYLNCLRDNLHCVSFSENPHRTLHLLHFCFKRTEHDNAFHGILPDRLAKIFSDVPKDNWRIIDTEMGYFSWYHDHCRHSFWTYCEEYVHTKAIYQLPWLALFNDLLMFDGGVLHGGLANFQNKGYLFIAPADGGKTTTLLKIPESWRVLADDAVLVWSKYRKIYSSPMPTWSIMLGANHALPRIDGCRIGSAIQLKGVFRIIKAGQDGVELLPAITAVPHFYQALCEHPGIVQHRSPYKGKLFHIACNLANHLSSRSLYLTLDDNKDWSLLSI